MDGFARYLTRTRRAAAAEGREFLLMGDLNIAHTRQDLAAWRRNQQTDGFLPEEREWLGQQLSPRTLVDVVRRLHPDEDGPYSWWSWLGQSFAKDAGWRIDYHLATPRLARSAVRAAVDREHEGTRLSDHSSSTTTGPEGLPEGIGSRVRRRGTAASVQVPHRGSAQDRPRSRPGRP